MLHVLPCDETWSQPLPEQLKWQVQNVTTRLVASCLGLLELPLW